MQNLQEIDTMTPQHGGVRENSGRKTNEEKGKPVRKPVSFTLYEEERETLKAQAAALGLSQSEYISAVIALGDVIVPLVRRATQAGDD